MRFTYAQLVELALLAVLLLHATPGLSQPSTGEYQSYAIQLEEGVNLVSLPIVPDVATMSEVIADISPALSLVQDDRGRHVIPDLEIDDIGTWKWSEAYKIHTRSPAILAVQGSTIIPDLSPLVLDGGAHWIPYLRSTSLSVEEALATILPSLSRVEDGRGRIYEPGNQSSTLDSLRVGRGYRVWLTQRDTLRYPGNQSSGGGNALQVGTLAEALALRDLVPGQEVETLGYYTPGDGGGGRFVVENSGAATDGGLVHVPNQHVSGVVTEVINNNSIQSKPFSIPPGSKLVFGTLTAELFHPNTDTELGVIDGRYLNGHQFVQKLTAHPSIDYEQGRLDDRHRLLSGWCGEVMGNQWSCDLRVTYRHTTSNIRLRRLGVGSTLNANWFGARTVSGDPNFDNQPVLAHTINMANKLNREVPGTITTVLLSSTGVYEYYGSLQLGEDLTLKGGGGTELLTVTNDLGHTYQPVRLKQNRTTLKVRDGEAMTHVRMLKPENDPYYLEPDLKMRLKQRQSTINVAPGAMRAGLADIVLDGNWEGNQEIWTEAWGTHQEREQYMRNTPSWSGFVSTSYQNVDIPQGQVLKLRNMAVQGYAAHGFLGNVNNTWDAENVRASDAAWNHLLYETNGTWRNLTLSGFAWGHTAFIAGEMYNFVFEDGVPGPYRPGREIHDIRGGDAFAPEDLLEPGADNTFYVQADGTLIELGTKIDGFYVDMRGSGLTIPFGGIGPNHEFRNGVVVRDDVLSPAVFTEFGNGLQRALYPNYTIENITVYDTGENGMGRLFGPLHITDSVIRNVTMAPAPVGTSGTGDHTLFLRAQRREHYSWDTPQVVRFEQIYSDAPRQFIAFIDDIRNNAAGIDYYIIDARFNNTTTSNTLFRNERGHGKLSGLNGNPNKMRVFMDGVEFNMSGGSWENLEIFFEVGRMQNCTDARSGRTSEDGGAFVYVASGGETKLDLPTNLLWEPLDPSYTSVTEGRGSSGLLDSFSYRAPGGGPLTGDRRGPTLRINLTRPLNPGEEVEFSWDAAVRPWEAGAGERPTDASYGSNNPLTRENGR